MRTGPIAPLVAVIAGLTVLGATTAGWVVDTVTRQVGGLEVPEVAVMTGAEIQPQLIVVGLVLLLSAVPLAVAKGRLRRLIGVFVGVVALVGMVLAVAGIVRAAELRGVLQASAWWALTGTGAGLVAGLFAAARTGRPASLPNRFEIDGREGAEDPQRDEWNLAVEDRGADGHAHGGDPDDLESHGSGGRESPGSGGARSHGSRAEDH